MPSPNVFAGYGGDAGALGKFGFGFGAWGPPRSDQIFSDDGAQRYSSITNENLQVHFGASLAWELYAPLKLRVGLTAMMVQVTIAQRLGLNSAGVFAFPEDPDYDIFADVSASDPAIFSGLYALSIEPIDGLTLGATFQTGFTILADGSLEVQIGDALARLASIEGDTVEIEARMPSIARLGVDYAPSDDPSWGLSTAVVWEGWGTNDVQTVRPVNISLTSAGTTEPLAPILILNNYQDTWSIRAGGFYELSNAFVLRLGLLYETSSVPDEYRSLGTFDLDKIGVTTGASYVFDNGLRLSLALGALQGLGADVTTSKVLAQDPLNPDGGTVIGNGRYETTQLISMLGFGYQF